MKPYFSLFLVITVHLLLTQCVYGNSARSLLRSPLRSPFNITRSPINTTRSSIYTARPYDIRWKIRNEVLILRWKFPIHLRPSGYYIHLQEVLDSQQNSVPKFVHVKSNLKTAKLRGLKPHTIYLIKIIAYTNRKSKSSHPIYVNTRYLEFLSGYNLTATNIQDTKATFIWYHKGNNYVHDVDFKLTCNGVLRHSDGNNGKSAVSFERYIQSTLSNVEHYSAKSLQPDTLYTCYLQTVAGSISSDPHSEIQFVTSSGKPPPPPKPKVIFSSKSDVEFTLELYKSDAKAGSISRYGVYAVPVVRSPNSARSTPIVPYSQLLSKAKPLSTASDSPKALPFTVAMYNNGKLPNSISFDNKFSWRKALKSNTHYTFVVVAFDGSKENRYSMSAPCDPPVYIGRDLKEEWLNKRKTSIKHFLFSALYTFLIVIASLFVVTSVLVFLLYFNHRKHDLVLNTGDTSDEEVSLYSRPNPSFKKKYKGLKDEGLNYKPVPTAEPYEARVKQIKRLSIHEEQEIKPELFSVATPPDSPRPTSPLVQSHRSSVETGNNSLATSSSPLLQHNQVLVRRESISLDYQVGAGHKKDFLSSSFTLPRSRPYISPESVIKGQYYYKSHAPGSPMPKMPDPEPPKPSKKSKGKDQTGSGSQYNPTEASDPIEVTTEVKGENPNESPAEVTEAEPTDNKDNPEEDVEEYYSSASEVNHEAEDDVDSSDNKTERS